MICIMSKNNRTARYTGRLTLPLKPTMQRVVERYATERNVSVAMAARLLLQAGMHQLCPALLQQADRDIPAPPSST